MKRKILIISITGVLLSLILLLASCDDLVGGKTRTNSSNSNGGIVGTGSGGNGSVKVVNDSDYSNDPIIVMIFKANGDTVATSSVISNGYSYTFTNIPTGITLFLLAGDYYDNIYESDYFSLSSGQTKTFYYTGDYIY